MILNTIESIRDGIYISDFEDALYYAASKSAELEETRPLDMTDLLTFLHKSKYTQKVNVTKLNIGEYSIPLNLQVTYENSVLRVKHDYAYLELPTNIVKPDNIAKTVVAVLVAQIYLCKTGVEILHYLREECNIKLNSLFKSTGLFYEPDLSKIVVNVVRYDYTEIHTGLDLSIEYIKKLSDFLDSEPVCVNKVRDSIAIKLYTGIDTLAYINDKSHEKYDSDLWKTLRFLKNKVYLNPSSLKADIVKYKGKRLLLIFKEESNITHIIPEISTIMNIDRLPKRFVTEFKCNYKVLVEACK